MTDVSLADLAPYRRRLHEAVVRADLEEAVEVFKAVLSVTDDDAASKMLAVLFGDLMVNIEHMDVVSFVQSSHPNTIPFYEAVSSPSTPEEQWTAAARFISNLSDVDRLELMKAFLGSTVRCVEIRSQSGSGFGGEIWLDQLRRAVKGDDLLGARELLVGSTDSDPLKHFMNIVFRFDTILVALSQTPQGLNGLAYSDDNGKVLVETAVKFEGWSRIMALRELVFDRRDKLSDLALLLLAVVKVHLVSQDEQG